MAGADEICDTKDLELERVIGFNGKVQGGLMVHPDREHIVYPLGNNIIIEDISNEATQCILSSHTNDVTCIAISNCGRYIVSGQETFMGFKASIILWDYATKRVITKWDLHKVKVQALAFSKSGKYVISLGGQDDGSVVVWDMATKEPVCGSPAQVESAGITTCLATSKVDDNVFVTGGDNTLRVWSIDKENRKIRPSNTNLGGFKRVITCIEMVDDQDENMPYFFCGTTTGDILCINKATNILTTEFPQKNKFVQGVTAVSFVKMTDKGFNVLIGSGNGIVGNYSISIAFEKGNKVKTLFKHRPDAEPWKHCDGAVTSIAKRGAGHQFFVGTEQSQIYKFQFADYTSELIKTCHSCPVNDIVFPFGVAQLIVTCQMGEIRVWNLNNGRELRRYCLANKVCNAVAISRDGKVVVSGWNDGKIRILGFKQKDLSLELKHVVMDAHNKGVSAVALTTRGDQIVSGGGDGMVRMWDIVTYMDHKGNKECRADLRHSMKEHKGVVSEIIIASSDKECASTSGDGTTIIWDLSKGSRKTVVFANTLFKSVCYGEDELQVITCGTDHKIGYWETYDGSMIRELEGAKAGSINFMDITADQKFFVTGGEEKLIKLWRYREGDCTHVGKGHSANIRRIRIAPDCRSIVSVSEDGAILQWRFPPC